VLRSFSSSSDFLLDDSALEGRRRIVGEERTNLALRRHTTCRNKLEVKAAEMPRLRRNDVSVGRLTQEIREGPRMSIRSSRLPNHESPGLSSSAAETVTGKTTLVSKCQGERMQSVIVGTRNERMEVKTA